MSCCRVASARSAAVRGWRQQCRPVSVMLNETPGDFVSKGSFDILFASVLVLGPLAVCAQMAQSPDVFVASIRSLGIN